VHILEHYSKVFFDTLLLTVTKLLIQLEMLLLATGKAQRLLTNH